MGGKCVQTFPSIPNANERKQGNALQVYLSVEE